jgi:hypothetical protein
MLLTIKLLLTIATLGYSAIPGIFDSNNTHATNPSWTGHARYHVVWQVSSYVYVAVVMLYLIWTAGAETKPLWIAAVTAGTDCPDYARARVESLKNLPCVPATEFALTSPCTPIVRAIGST